NEIWSVGLTAAGEFDAGTERLELQMPLLVDSSGVTQNYSNPVSDIAFKPITCCMLLAERSMTFDTGSNAHRSRLLEYCFNPTTGAWDPSPNIFNVGQSPVPNSSAGGCDYDFDTCAS